MTYSWHSNGYIFEIDGDLRLVTDVDVNGDSQVDKG